MLDNVEADGLREWTALADGNNISDLAFEGGGAVDRDVAVTLFVTAVLGDVVKVITADDDGALHLGGDDKTLEDTASNGDVPGEGAFFVDVVAINGSLGCFETKTNGPVVSGCAALEKNFLGAEEDTILLLEGFFGLCDKVLGHGFFGLFGWCFVDWKQKI